MFVDLKTVEVTTDGSGDATEYSDIISGEIREIYYKKAASGNFSDGVDFTITLERTGQTVWAESNVNASKSVAPVRQVNLTDGTAAATSASDPVLGRIATAYDRIKIVVASGGALKTGTFYILVGG